MQNNLEAVLQVMKFIYDNIIYAELNTKSDYCQVCGWDGEIDIVEDLSLIHIFSLYLFSATTRYCEKISKTSCICLVYTSYERSRQRP